MYNQPLYSKALTNKAKYRKCNLLVRLLSSTVHNNPTLLLLIQYCMYITNFWLTLTNYKKKGFWKRIRIYARDVQMLKGFKKNIKVLIYMEKEWKH